MSHPGQLPTPDVYLNHYSPDHIVRFEVSRDLSLALLGAMIWDILVYVPDDIKIIRRSRLQPVVFCFVFSRIFALTFVLLGVIVTIRPLANCKGFAISVAIMWILSMSSTSFLFLQRVWALYPDNRVLRYIFCFLWIVATAVMSTAAIGTKSAHVPGIRYCTYSVVDRYLGAGSFAWLFFDTLVFLMISYKIASSHSALSTDDKTSWNTIVSGKALPRLSRAVLQGGQQYYLIAICLSLPDGILMVIPSTPLTYKLLMCFPLVALTSSMACRVFRNMRMHDLKHETDFVISDLNFRPPHSRTTVTPATIALTREAQSSNAAVATATVKSQGQEPSGTSSGGVGVAEIV